MVTPANFRARLPEFTLANAPDALVQRYIDESDPFFDATRWDDMLDTGVIFWVAHTLVIDQQNAKTQITDDAVMKKVGDISKQRDSTLMNKQVDNPYMRTYYGQRYLFYAKFIGRGSLAV